MYIYIYAYMYVCICMCIYIYICTYIHANIRNYHWPSLIYSLDKWNSQGQAPGYRGDLEPTRLEPKTAMEHNIP